MFEQKSDRLLPFNLFIRRMALSLALAFVVVFSALGVGTLGYHFIGDLPWIDGLLNASMILTGMGPVDPMKTTAAKLFATGYALFSGVVFLSSVGFVLSPVFHRILHSFHLDEQDESADGKAHSR